MAGVGRPKGLPKTGGRKKGVPNKATADVKALAQEYGPQAISVLVTLMAGASSDQAKVAAARELLDRGYGKPSQHLGVDANVHARTLAEEIQALDDAMKGA